jgi:hypothetical protein
MAKAASPFAGVKLTDQTSLSRPGLDQRLFGPPTLERPEKLREAEESQEVGKVGNRETRKEVPQPGKREVGQVFDINEKPYRKDSLLFTANEFEALEDLKLELRRRFDLPATKNDIARCALQNLIEDYQQHQEKSVVVHRLKTRSTR